MTRLEKLIQAEREILELQTDDYPDLFSRILPQKMQAFLALCYFDDLDDEKLHHYFSRYIELYKLEIEWSKNMGPQVSGLQQNYFLRACKDLTCNLRETVVMGFEHLRGSLERLQIEED